MTFVEHDPLPPAVPEDVPSLRAALREAQARVAQYDQYVKALVMAFGLPHSVVDIGAVLSWGDAADALPTAPDRAARRPSICPADDFVPSPSSWRVAR